MLQVQQLSKSYGADDVLSDVSFIVNDGERVGLVGPNGTGKSTILRCIACLEQPDAGTISLSPGTTVGYLPQTFDHLHDQTVGEVVFAAQGEWAEASSALARAADRLAAATDLDRAAAAYEAALSHFEALGGYEREHQTSAILHGLGLGDLDHASPVATLSGGQKTRLGLAALLIGAPTLLLLDEPTNHLDVDGLEWLEGFIRGYPGAVLIVSHDREFLDQTVTRILYLDPETRSVRSYAGNYRDFAAARQHEREAHLEAWKHQQSYVARVERDVARLKGEALAIERSTTPRQPGVRKLARKKAQVAKARERKLDRFLESDERVEKPRLGWGLKIDFGTQPVAGRDVLRLEDVTFAYPGGPPVIRGANLAVQSGERIAVVGPNGAGKSTLLRLIDGRLAPLAGNVHLGASVRMGTIAQEQETLDRDATVLQAALDARPMSETDARSFLHFFLFEGDSVFRRVGDCSLGEQKRLQLALLVLEGCNLLLLDEPLNHLDVDGREHFAAALDAFEGTVIAVVHDRAFLRDFAERVVEVRDSRVRVFEGGYDAYLRQRSRAVANGESIA